MGKGRVRAVTDLKPPNAVLDIARRLEQAGYETWCVGGAVRDALLGIPSLDWDFATAATPAQVMRVFRRTVPVGVEHGTVGVLDDDGVLHEVTTFRRDVRTDGRHAVVEFGASLDDDLARRDFTINAIAYSPRTAEVRDPFGGQDDLRRRVLRSVGDPRARMREDRLRALRAIRFAARFDFEIDPPTWRAVVESAPHLTRLSAERVKQEIEKTLEQVERPSRALARWQESGALGVVAPLLGSVPDAQLLALDCVRRPGLTPHAGRRTARQLARLALLALHLPRGQAEQALRALKCSNEQVRWVGEVVERWERLGAAMSAGLAGATSVGDGQLRRWAAAAGRTRLAPLLRTASAYWCGQRALGAPAPSAEVIRGAYRRSIRVAYRDPVELADLAVDGDDLRESGIPAGPLLGKILHALLDRVVDDPGLNERQVLLAMALELYGQWRGDARPPSDHQ